MNRVSNIQSVLGDKTNSLDENLIKQDFGVWTVSLILVFVEYANMDVDHQFQYTKYCSQRRSDMF